MLHHRLSESRFVPRQFLVIILDHPIVDRQLLFVTPNSFDNCFVRAKTMKKHNSPALDTEKEVGC